MTKHFLYEFISRNKYAVLSTVTKDSLPESALVGFAITPDLKIIFDTSRTSRKYENLINNSSIAFTIGWSEERTVQYEGSARVPSTTEIDILFPFYQQVFPDSMERRRTWRDIVYFCVEPRWIRYSDFNVPVQIEEMRF